MPVMTPRLLCFAVFAVLTGCQSGDRSTAPPVSTLAIDSAYVERGDDGVLVLQWSGAADAVDIYAAATPEAAASSQLVVQGASGVVRLPAYSDSSARPFFRIVPAEADEAAGLVVVERHLPLAGASNFRDLGGYQSADGRRIRWGQVYRTGSLADLTRTDLALFSDLGIRMVCDLRRPHEVESMPDRLPALAPPPDHERGHLRGC